MHARVLSFPAVLALTTLAVLAPAAQADEVKLTHAQAAENLRDHGITWSSPGSCSSRTNPDCTSFEQIRANTVSNVITLRTASGCPVNITAGTEAGHASGTYSHWNGYRVDLSPNSCLHDYVTSHFTYIGLRPGTTFHQYKSAAGNIYCLEGDHWDVLYY